MFIDHKNLPHVDHIKYQAPINVDDPFLKKIEEAFPDVTLTTISVRKKSKQTWPVVSFYEKGKLVYRFRGADDVELQKAVIICRTRQWMSCEPTTSCGKRKRNENLHAKLLNEPSPQDVADAWKYLAELDFETRFPSVLISQEWVTPYLTALKLFQTTYGLLPAAATGIFAKAVRYEMPPTELDELRKKVGGIFTPEVISSFFCLWNAAEDVVPQVAELPEIIGHAGALIYEIYPEFKTQKNDDNTSRPAKKSG